MHDQQLKEEQLYRPYRKAVEAILALLVGYAPLLLPSFDERLAPS